MKKLLGIIVACLLFAGCASTGCLKGNCVNGEGTFRYNSGNEYVGEWQNDKRHGQGTYTWADGDKEVGSYRKNKYLGELIRSDELKSLFSGKTVYEEDGEKEYHAPDGTCYYSTKRGRNSDFDGLVEGKWYVRNNQICYKYLEKEKTHCFERFRKSNNIYIYTHKEETLKKERLVSGDIDNLVFQARGYTYIADKNTGCKIQNSNPVPNEAVTWSGKCVNSVAQGKGTLQWYKNDVKKDKYVGNYVDGKMHGKGTKWYADGQIQDGNWKDGEFTSGHTYIADKNTGCRIQNPNPVPNEAVTWSGRCVKGIAQGKGTLQWYKNGVKKDKYVGNYVDGNMHGKGTYWYASGDKYTGKWENGERLGKTEHEKREAEKNARRYERMKNCQHLYVGKTVKLQSNWLGERFSVVGFSSRSGMATIKADYDGRHREVSCLDILE